MCVAIYTPGIVTFIYRLVGKGVHVHWSPFEIVFYYENYSYIIMSQSCIQGHFVLEVRMH